MDAMITAIISGAGALISALIAFIVSKKQIATALDTVRLQTQAVFIGKLYEKRLIVYPQLYQISSELGDKIRSTGITIDELSSALEHIREWDKRNAIFLSPFTVTKLIHLRRICNNLLKSIDGMSKRRQKKELLPVLIELEMCLKTELGIIHVDSFHNPDHTERLREVIERLQKDYE